MHLGADGCGRFNYIPTPERDLDKPFLMPIEDVFSIKGRGTVVTGRVDRGTLKVGEEVEIVGLRERRKRQCAPVWRCSTRCWTRGRRVTTSACCCGASAGTDVERGQVVAKPKSITPHQKFNCEVYVLRKDEGGRHKAFFPGYRPQFYMGTMDVTGSITLPEGVEMVMPGDRVNMAVELITPVAMERGSKFAIREGGLTVGAGVITEVIE